MGRWEPNALGRLERAAMSLYLEQGFEQTTVAEIAQRAGLTERTFFRHYADKREVLFAGAPMLQELLVSAVVGAPADRTPMEAAAIGLDAVGERFRDGRAFAVQRHSVISSNPELQERELIKLATLTAALSGALEGRGAGAAAARLTAEVAITVFKVAFERWVDGDATRTLSELMRDVFGELQAVAATG